MSQVKRTASILSDLNDGLAGNDWLQLNAQVGVGQMNWRCGSSDGVTCRRRLNADSCWHRRGQTGYLNRHMHSTHWHHPLPTNSQTMGTWWTMTLIVWPVMAIYLWKFCYSWHWRHGTYVNLWSQPKTKVVLCRLMSWGWITPTTKCQSMWQQIVDMVSLKMMFVAWLTDRGR